VSGARPLVTHEPNDYMALNVVRLANWFAGYPRIRTKPAPFVALFPAAA